VVPGRRPRRRHCRSRRAGHPLALNRRHACVQG
jgi:hypothetical protein